ncbi:MAG: class I SAM-dependent methyltransferase [Firmicutes bacterium]|nr:class I SAM-dependent methyltransferase [Bacillota bacterium]
MEPKRGRGKTVNPFERAMLNLFVYKLRKGKSVLSLGCGVGIPYEQFLCMLKCVITGVDGDKNAVVQAMVDVPRAKFVCENILTYNTKETFNGLLLIDAHQHLPKDTHRELFCKANNLLCEEGVLLVTVPPQNAMADGKLYDLDTTVNILDECGFKLIVSENQTEYGIKNDLNWVLLRKKPTTTSQMKM